MDKTILLIATHDTKEEEARFLKSCIKAHGTAVLVMDTGILAAPKGQVDISQEEVADRAGTPLEEALARGLKGSGFGHCCLQKGWRERWLGGDGNMHSRN